MHGVHFNALKWLTCIMITWINNYQQLIKVNGLTETFKHCSIAVFPKLLLLAGCCWLRKITTDPHILADINRRMHKCGGVCIFIQENIHYTNINMDRYSIEKDIEICAVKLHISSRTIVIITVYRSPTGNIACFLDNLEAALN